MRKLFCGELAAIAVGRYGVAAGVRADCPWPKVQQRTAISINYEAMKAEQDNHLGSEAS